MKMNSVEVSVVNAEIILTQENNEIILTAEQAKIVATWINDAAALIDLPISRINYSDACVMSSERQIARPRRNVEV